MEEHQRSGAGGETTSSGGCGVRAADSEPGSVAPKTQGHTGLHHCELGDHEPDEKVQVNRVCEIKCSGLMAKKWPVIYSGLLKTTKTISGLFPGRKFDTVNHFAAWTAVLKKPLRHPTNQPSDQPFSPFPHNSHGIQAMDKEGPVPERSSFSFNERA